MLQSRVLLSPSVDDRTYIVSVFLVRQQMVGVIQRDKAFGMTRFLVNLAGVIDPDDFVDGAVEDDERALEAPNGLFHRGLLQVVYKLLSDRKGPPTDFDFGLPVESNFFEGTLEQV